MDPFGEHKQGSILHPVTYLIIHVIIHTVQDVYTTTIVAYCK